MGNFYSCWAEHSAVCRTSSVCTTEATTGAHKFVVKNYSLLVGSGADEYVSSSTFSVGGYDWNIYFYPDGDRRAPDHVAAFLHLRGGAAAEKGVKVWYRLSLREKGGKVHPAGPLLIQKFTSDGNIGYGNIRLAHKSKLRGDRFTIKCELVVINKPTVQAL
ncbi:hypothetical protein ACQJBY_011855 [Aegilops geniculata]